MKFRNFKISIFMVIISIFACGFIGMENNKSVYAAEEAIQQCYYLISEETPYESNIQVGTVEGLGKFVVGEENVVLTAKANENYQLVGWNVKYKEQSDKVEYFDVSGLVDGKKEIILTAKDSTEVKAILNFNLDGVYFTSGTFTLTNVFENLEISPVFDFIYYKIDATELMYVSTLINSFEIDGNTLYYDEAVISGDATKYTNAYLKVENNYYYYGDFYKETISGSISYYTLHKTAQETAIDEKVNYLRGAFRVNETVNLGLDVTINTADIKNSTNIDLIGVDVFANLTNQLSAFENGSTNNFFKITQDEYLRTKAYEIKFEVYSENNYVNKIDLNYHRLYVADLKLTVDGNAEHDEINDLFGSTEIFENYVSSNISIYNFYSRIGSNNLRYLIKSAQDNGNVPFMITCANVISKTIDGNNYKYYNFSSIDASSSNSKSYTTINNNIEIVIDYSSVKHDINFNFAVKEIDNNGNSQLVIMSGNVLPAQPIKRGQTISLDETDVATLENVGYRFIGYAINLTDEVGKTISYTADNEKPKGTTILLCYEKIEYTIVFTNYNQVKIGTNVPINTATFTTTRNSNILTETITPLELTETSVTLSNKLKLGDSFKIDTKTNEGFSVLGYTLTYMDPNIVTAEDCFTSFEFTQDFIKGKNLSETITIYVYEKLLTYTLTYFIEPTLDSNKADNVIMANIEAESLSSRILKYDIYGVLISEENNNLTAVVAKIELIDLKLGDEVLLKSSALTVGEGAEAYTYVFNWFTEDDKSTLSYEVDGNFYNHKELVKRDKTIKVVYSMPNTKVLITIDQEYAEIEKFSFELTVVQSGNVISPEVEGGNSYVVEVGTLVTITISNLAFGYQFVGYLPYGSSAVVEVNGTSFDYSAYSGINNLVLRFERIEYRFVFTQYGGGKNGENVVFDGNNFAILNIDSTSLRIEKPIGYYVASVKFGAENIDTYSTALSENNNYRFNSDIMTYSFRLTREQFVDLVQNYSDVNVQGIGEVQVRLDYLIFTYSVEVSYSLTNPKGDSRDDYVIFPSIILNYTYNEETITATKINGTKKVTFTNIPYGSNGILRVLSGAPTGLSVTGWRYGNDDIVMQEEYEHSSNQLTLGKVTYDKEFKYKLTYNAYELNIVYEPGQGDPNVYINNKLVTSTVVQITLYDKLEINANALRNNGYIFKRFEYMIPLYREYTYDADSWDLEKNTLYTKNGDSYELNTLPDYDPEKTYYVYSEQTHISTNSTFVDDSFHVLNYALDGKTINFTIEYELLQMNIVNNLKEKRSVWTLTGIGTGDARIEFALNDMASFNVSAKDSRTSIVREIGEYDTVTFYDLVTIYVSINKSATNVDGKVYDLTKGLILKTIKMYGESCGFVGLGDGVYTLSFNVGESMPATGETIALDYTLEIDGKDVNVTTVVTNSTEFYKNLTMHINAKDAGFESSPIVSMNNESKLEHSLQFLATASMYTSFTSDDYKNNFKISGVTIYCDGLEITSAQYEEYGIEFIDNIVTAQFLYDIDVVFKVQPIITYNGGPIFEKVFMCDSSGIGVEQTLSVGSNSNYDIQITSLIVNSIKIQYLLDGQNSYPTDSVVNVGEYVVLITFDNTTEYDWLKEISIADIVKLNIIKKNIYLSYKPESIEKVTKQYDGISDWDASLIYKYLIFTDNLGFELPYSNVLSTGTNNLALKKASAYISVLGEGDKVKDANESVYYNLFVYNLSLKENAFNNNFNLTNGNLLINNYIQITKREIKLSGLQVYDKVYDGTDMAELALTDNITIINAVTGDKISLNPEYLSVKFADKNIGVNKTVIIDATDALTGSDVKNYFINEERVTGLKIYPYSLSVKVEGVGEITIMNRRGLTDKTKVDLIPVNASFRVMTIRPDTVEYANIYKHISQYLRGNNEFSIGYKLELTDGGKVIQISNDLHLSVPKAKNITGSYFLTGERAGSVTYKTEGNKLIIDLSQINENVSQVFLTQKRILLKLWQIILIVVLAVLVIATVILVVIILRKRKLERYSVNEKI